MEELELSDARQRISDWLDEGQRTLRGVFEGLLHERDTLRGQVVEAEQRCARIERDARDAWDELAALREKYRQLQGEYTEITHSVTRVLSQMTGVFEPLRDLADRLGRLAND